jgi:hypothetical protein
MLSHDHRVLSAPTTAEQIMKTSLYETNKVTFKIMTSQYAVLYTHHHYRQRYYGNDQVLTFRDNWERN